MARWRIVFSHDAHKQYKKLPIGYRRNIDAILKKLAGQESIDIKPIKGEKDVYRIRIGKYRILFSEIVEDNTCFIFRISTRGKAYKK